MSAGIKHISRKYTFFLCFLMSLTLFINMALAGDYVRGGYGFCVSISFDIESLKRKNFEKLKSTEMELQENKEKLSEIKRLLAKIQKAKTLGSRKQKRDAIHAEVYARNAYRQLKKRNVILAKQKMDLEMSLNILKQDEERLGEFCNKLASMKSGGLVRKCSGSVKVISGQGQERSCSNYMILREGETISTGSDGSADLYIVGGRGTLNLAPNSRVSLLKETPEANVIEFIKGKAKFSLEKIKKFREKTIEWWKSYKGDIKEIQDWINRIPENTELSVWVCKHMRIEGSFSDCFGRRMVNVGVRGTTFRVERKEGDEINIYVLEGVVEVTVNLGKQKKIFKVEDGKKLTIMPNGTVTLQAVSTGKTSMTAHD